MNEWVIEWIDECFEVSYECMCTCVVNVNEERVKQACQAEAAILLDLFWGDFDTIRQGRMCEWVSEREREWLSDWVSR